MGENHLSDLQILKEIAELLNRGTDPYIVLSEVLKKLLHVTGLQTGWIFLIDDSGRLELAAKENLPPALSQSNYTPMCSGDCWCIDRYSDGRLDKATNIIECKRLEDAIERKTGDTRGLTHHATVPLKAGDEKFGILNVGSPFKKHFTNGELALLESVALQIGTALKRIKLTHKDQEIALAAERNRLARDLHDSVNQLLFSLSLTASGGKEMTDKREVKETFGYIQDLAQEALNEMRALIWQLRPRGLEKGIVSALCSYGEMLGLTVNIKVNGVIHLPCAIEEGIWRIGQEALANCKKHSGQSIVDLSIEASETYIMLIFKDKGSGFIYDDTKELPSLGLKSMKNRTKSLAGSFKLKSNPGKGTTVQVKIPF
ncbi:GAF domain-containing sensor histidine kinase [Neobacillus niacini]|uniref:GAF domain-containing sensor histidine kinase n=1 Tax=Neobacillus niacini TaxID=86668 RepID=UPI0021CB38FB|nr:GAF domain-containing sensor histidine kinase [Neobacillus niacini]MCM3767302.1 GAF domain-containing sensor histidine kinase [Neobacillus niacini]